MNYKDFFKHLSYVKEASEIIKIYLLEPVAFKIKAEPGWKLVALGPTDDEYEVVVDFIDVEEWVYFTSLRLTDYSKENSIKRALINSQMEQSVPKIPSNYSGKLKGFFDSIKKDFPNWNGVTFPSLMIGCIHVDENTDFEDIEKKAKEIWKSSRERIKKEQENIRKFSNVLNVKQDGDLQSLLDGLLSTNVDKSKLN